MSKFRFWGFCVACGMETHLDSGDVCAHCDDEVSHEGGK